MLRGALGGAGSPFISFVCLHNHICEAVQPRSATSSAISSARFSQVRSDSVVRFASKWQGGWPGPRLGWSSPRAQVRRISAGCLGWGLDRCSMECARPSPRVFTLRVCLPVRGPGRALAGQDGRLGRFPCLWTRLLGGDHGGGHRRRDPAARACWGRPAGCCFLAFLPRSLSCRSWQTGLGAGLGAWARI